MNQIAKQYASSSNLESRMHIYQFSTNKESLQQWISKKIGPLQNADILELGCGTGQLWKYLAEYCTDCRITVSDASHGMLDASRELLNNRDYQFRVIDFHDIPIKDNSIDIVISNHNLYHARELNVVLSEIHRVLKPGGRFFSVTNSEHHLLEIRQLLGIYEAHLWSQNFILSAFNAENGREILANHFSIVERADYINELHITDVEAVFRYYFSVSDEHVQQLATSNEQEIRARFAQDLEEHGYFPVIGRSCMFTCRK